MLEVYEVANRAGVVGAMQKCIQVIALGAAKRVCDTVVISRRQLRQNV